MQAQKITKRINSMLLVLVVIGASCTYDTLEEPDSCGVSEATYRVDVAPLLEQSCIGCHDSQFSSGGIALDSYDEVRSVVERGRLLGAIRHDDGFSPMPQGAPRFSDCSITTIENWIANGAQNN